MSQIYKISELGQAKVYPTFFLPEIDEAMGDGFESGTLNIITGSTGLGKSIFACNIAYNQSIQGLRVLFISTEMKPVDILARLYALHSDRSIRDFKRDNNNELIKEVEQAISPIWERLELMFTSNFVDIMTHLDENSSKYDVVIIDHVHCLTFNPLKFRTEIERDEFTINELKKIWERGLCIIAVAQLNKSKFKSFADHENIRGSAHWIYLSSQILYFAETKAQNDFNYNTRSQGQPELLTLCLTKFRDRGQQIKCRYHQIQTAKWKCAMKYDRPITPKES
jgi:archaellum biogenesis ATPase FlaH